MPSASTLRKQIEAVLADRIPAALSPVCRTIRPVAPTGIDAVDELLDGGIPIGAITELAGPECSGRTSLAHSFLACITRSGSVAAWVDVSDTFDPESAAAAGAVLDRVLWVRCGAVATTTHGRTGSRFLREEMYLQPQARGRMTVRESAPWKRLDKALRVTDLLLQAGGFRAIVLDMGSVAAEVAARVPLATWFRYRAAAERSQSSLVLLTGHSCATSSAELLLRFRQGEACDDERTVFTGMKYRVDVERSRFAQATSNVVLLRKPPLREKSAEWRSRPAWAGVR